MVSLNQKCGNLAGQACTPPPGLGDFLSEAHSTSNLSGAVLHTLLDLLRSLAVAF